MAKGYISAAKYKAFLGNVKIKKGYIGTTKVYSAGNICTYQVNADVAYQEEMDEDVSCLSPASFTPSLNGWTFIGWRTDQTASGDVLHSLVMGEDPVTLYAVFRQTITLSYSGNGATSGNTTAQTGYRYYNNGNVTNPSFTVKVNGFKRSGGYVFSKWTLNSTSGTQYSPNQSITLSSNGTLYASWTNIVTSGSLKLEKYYSGADGTKPKTSSLTLSNTVLGTKLTAKVTYHFESSIYSTPDDNGCKIYNGNTLIYSHMHPGYRDDPDVDISTTIDFVPNSTTITLELPSYKSSDKNQTTQWIHEYVTISDFNVA